MIKNCGSHIITLYDRRMHVNQTRLGRISVKGIFIQTASNCCNMGALPGCPKKLVKGELVGYNPNIPHL